MVSLIIGMFNIIVGHMLSDHAKPLGRLLAALNFMFAGSNITIFVIRQIV